MLRKVHHVKTELALCLQVSVSGMYIKHTQPKKDEVLKELIEGVLQDNPAYGHKRIAMQLGMDKKKVLRVMKLYGIKPYRRRKKPRKRNDEGKEASIYKNLIKYFCPIRPGVVWVSDFTYIWYKDHFIYLATIMDLYTREIIGLAVSERHDQELVIAALLDALTKQNAPAYLHSDQGSEYDATAYEQLCINHAIHISKSAKASPWENAFQESFYSHFKVELADPERFAIQAELLVEIYRLIHYYNHYRIHSTLAMSPNSFRLQYLHRENFFSNFLGT